MFSVKLSYRSLNLHESDGDSFDQFMSGRLYDVLYLNCNDYPMCTFIQIVVLSDNFLFQNNGIKKCTCWKTMSFLGKQCFFFEKQWFFLKKQCF